MRKRVLVWLTLFGAALAALAPAAEPDRCEPPSTTATSATGPAADNARGNELARRGDFAAARTAHAEAERAARASADTDLALRAGANAARDAVELGDRAGARTELAALVTAARALPDATARAQLLLHLGRSQAQNQDGPAAVETLRAAASAAQQAGDQRLLSFALGWEGELYERAGRRAEALDLTRRALFAAQTADAPDALYRWQWQLGRLRLADGDREAALVEHRAAASTLARMRAEGSAPLAGDRSFARDVEPMYDGLVDLLLQRAQAAEQADARQALLAEARNTLEDQKAAELRDYFRDDCLDSERRAAPESIAGALVVYPILLPDRTELVIGTPAGLESVRVPVGRDELTREVNELRTKLEKRTTRQYLPHAEKVYDWLIRPLEAKLADPSLAVLVFVPTGPLRTIPIAALHDKATNQFLIERVPLAITPGLSLTDPRRIDRGNVSLLSAGISQSVQGFAPLENVPAELAAVNASFPGETLLNDQFAVARFEGELGGRAFGIVHIASHGEFTADISQSFLLAWDGKIAMTELASLVGSTRFRTQPLELLTLSACETAAGDDRAALGLAGVAVRAGARSALATLWAVNDQAASDLLAEFYKQLADPAVSRAQALQRAQLSVLRTYRWRHPGYWSPYLLISSWL